MTRFEPGGTERQMIELIRRLDPARFRVHVACFHREGAWLPRVVERAASVVEFPIHGFARPSTVWQLFKFARWCRRERIAVVQTCDLYANTFGLPGAALAGVPVRIGSRRELNPDKTDGQIRLQRLAYRFATKVAANSQAARQMLEQEGVASIVHCGDSQRPRRSTRSLNERARPERSGPSSPSPTCGAEKSHETLLAAAAVLLRDHPDLQFQIVGDGPRRRRARGAVGARADCPAHVEFLGHREDVPALLAAADAFVLPSTVRGVSQRRDRGDGGRTAGRGQRRRRAARSHRPGPDRQCSCRREIPRRWRARCSRSIDDPAGAEAHRTCRRDATCTSGMRSTA